MVTSSRTADRPKIIVNCQHAQHFKRKDYDWLIPKTDMHQRSLLEQDTKRQGDDQAGYPRCSFRNLSLYNVN